MAATHAAADEGDIRELGQFSTPGGGGLGAGAFGPGLLDGDG